MWFKLWYSISPYEIPVIVLKFEIKSDIKGYHAYMNSWKLIIREDFQPCPDLRIWWVNMLWLFWKIHGLWDIWLKRNLNNTLHFLRANQSNSAVVTVKGKRTNYGDGQHIQIPCTIKFKVGAKCIKILQEPANFIFIRQ